MSISDAVKAKRNRIKNNILNKLKEGPMTGRELNDAIPGDVPTCITELSRENRIVPTHRTKWVASK